MFLEFHHALNLYASIVYWFKIIKLNNNTLYIQSLVFVSRQRIFHMNVRLRVYCYSNLGAIYAKGLCHYVLMDISPFKSTKFRISGNYLRIYSGNLKKVGICESLGERVNFLLLLLLLLLLVLIHLLNFHSSFRNSIEPQQFVRFLSHWRYHVSLQCPARFVTTDY